MVDLFNVNAILSIIFFIWFLNIYVYSISLRESKLQFILAIGLTLKIVMRWILIRKSHKSFIVHFVIQSWLMNWV